MLRSKRSRRSPWFPSPAPLISVSQRASPHSRRSRPAVISLPDLQQEMSGSPNALVPRRVRRSRRHAGATDSAGGGSGVRAGQRTNSASERHLPRVGAPRCRRRPRGRAVHAPAPGNSHRGMDGTRSRCRGTSRRARGDSHQNTSPASCKPWSTRAPDAALAWVTPSAIRASWTRRRAALRKPTLRRGGQ